MSSLFRVVWAALAFAAASCGSGGGPPDGSGGTPPGGAGGPPAVVANDHAVVLIFGSDVLPAVRDRVTALVTASAPLPVKSGDPSALPPPLASGSIVLSFGDTKTTQTIVDGGALAKLGPEGIVVRSGTVSGAALVAAVGNAPDKATADHGNLGTSFAAYALLEQIGFAFLHPLAPTVPAKLALPSASIDVAESPAWRIRGVHLHTQHPLELTEMLQGWGKSGPGDEAGWTARLPEWDRYLDWMLANRQNRVEWVLLWADSWSAFADGPVRQQRLATLVTHAHDRGIAVGADASLALQQQHAYRLVRTTGDLASETQQIHDHLDWFFGAGFDFFSTESGTTEFTHPDPARILAWMSEAATYAKSKYGRPAYIKAHCSTGQTAAPYTDPVTGAPINFNFLPHYADPSLGVMPHTVQIYGLDDPAPTYGNTDFGTMKNFLEEEVGTREVVWHPETAYWVTYDIDVPLFLPTYAERRVSDLRLLAADEKAGKMGRGAKAGGRMDGQMIFSSGWEWGYWLNDVVAARAAWNPHLEAGSSREALAAVLAPVARALGAAGADGVTWIADWADAERALLIRGEVSGVAPQDITKRNGMAYLEGYDAMDDVGNLGSKLGLAVSPVTQPEKVGLVDLQSILSFTGPDYASEIAPLLTEMDVRFDALAARGDALGTSAPPEAKDLVDDLVDASRITALRARQVHGLYDYAAKYPSSDAATRKGRLAAARAALDDAAKVVAAREPRYRVEADRIAGWHDNPTAYGFTYLWFTRSLYFWWRDEGKAVDAPTSPCYLNVMDPANVALGEGIAADTATAIRNALGGAATECLAAPATPPTFPQDNLRSRP
jgi:hypothetical protein